MADHEPSFVGLAGRRLGHTTINHFPTRETGPLGGRLLQLRHAVDDVQLHVVANKIRSILVERLLRIRLTSWTLNGSDPRHRSTK